MRGSRNVGKWDVCSRFYVFYLQIFLRMFFNLLMRVTEKVVDNYLAEHCSSKHSFKDKKET